MKPQGMLREAMRQSGLDRLALANPLGVPPHALDQRLHADASTGYQPMPAAAMRELSHCHGARRFTGFRRE